MLDSFPRTYRNQLEDWYSDQYVLQADLVNQPCGSAEVAQAYFDAHPDDFTQYCVSVIVLERPEPGQHHRGAGPRGRDFAALAQQNSTDPQTARTGRRRRLPLAEPSSEPRSSPTVQATPVGGVSDPISDNQGGFVILKLNDKKPAAFTDVQSEAQSLAIRDQSVEFGSWLQKAQAASHVTVDPRYGTFDRIDLQHHGRRRHDHHIRADRLQPADARHRASDQPPSAGP